jgi:hypothetical protein
LKETKNTDRFLRPFAARELYRSDRHRPTALAVFKELMNGKELGLTLIVLNEMGPDARDVLPQLRALLARTNERFTRMEIKRAIWRINPGE